MAVSSKIKVGLYGSNGHQVAGKLVDNSLAQLVAVASYPKETLSKLKLDHAGLKYHSSLDELLANSEVELVSLCSPKRSDQAKDAIKALRAGKHVYAEKPCAMDEASLDEILKAARETGKQFHEMAGTVFVQPYFTMRKIVKEGTIGEVVQVQVEKSYPYNDRRPQDENIDGGLIGQAAIHAVRMIEHAACVSISSVSAMETRHGNPVKDGGLRMAATLMLGLKNGGLASVTANYLNQKGAGTWGYETLRILGTKGFVESTQGGKQTRLVVGEKDHGPLDVSHPGLEYFNEYLKTLLGQGQMPLMLEEELSSTRWVIRAKKNLQSL